MTTVWSCLLVVNRKLANDHRHAHDFIDDDSFPVGRHFYSIFKCVPNANSPR